MMLPFPPQEATKMLLAKFSSRRMRDVIEKRFGLRGGKKKTLEAVGKEYRITRERVRQIEADALGRLRSEEAVREVAPAFQALEDHLQKHGEVMAAHHLYQSCGDLRLRPHLALLLTVSRKFHDLPESDLYHRRWTINKTKAEVAERIMNKVVQALEEEKRPVSRGSLLALLGKLSQEEGGDAREEVLESYLATSRLMSRNPYGEYGLASWPTINPRGIRDKAYAVLVKSGAPLHFRNVAKAIDKVGWSKRKAHPQTVHNELIKDSRFVLVGRGLYALKEWGYEPGVVRDVMTSVLKSAGAPLSQDDMVRLVTEKRFVKPQTILLNLQNKSLFKKTEDGRYMLV